MTILQKRLMISFIIALFELTAAFGAASDTSHPNPNDSLNLPLSIDALESNVRSTLMFGGSSPVSFSGEGRMKMQHHYFRNPPDYLRADRSWNESNWEGNESMIRLGMVVRPSRNTVLWSKIGFQNSLPGFYTNSSAVTDTAGAYGFTREQYAHDKMTDPANIHEDMSAGIAIRTIPASFQLRMGNIQWTEASPLTIWKSQPRNMAWDFLPYEIEQPVSRYYEYNIAKGAKEGRASWHKKAFNGIDLESINLPANLYFNAMYATFERYDNCEREYIDFSNDLAYAGLSNEAKGRGIGDSYRHMMHARLAMAKLLGDLTFGINYVGITYNRDLFANPLLWSAFKFASANPFAISSGVICKAFYKEPKIASIDVRGMVTNQLELQGDLAASIVDTTHVQFDSAGPGEHFTSSSTPPSPAVYAHLKSTYIIPASLDMAVISREFYSPFSFAAPVDAFFPYGANLIGAGKFLARGEASPYAQNMAGACLNVMPTIGYGHMKFTYGQHAQIDRARDVLFFPYRLNGEDLFSVFQSSYNRWGNDLIDQSITSGTYKNRLGDQSYTSAAYKSPYGPEAGGLRSDYLAMFEGFVPYEDSAQAASNNNEKTAISTRSVNVPVHRKYTFNCEMDCAYDISGLIGFNHDFFLSGYAALNGVSTSMTPIAVSQKSQLLWSGFLRFEPAIALTDKFYLLGLAGIENWRSDQAWMINDSTYAVQNVPIDFRDVAYGLGFDWEMGSRMGLHCRAKWMEHEDRYYMKNNWKTPIVSSEIKMWF
jgi:hypothetical protein